MFVVLVSTACLMLSGAIGNVFANGALPVYSSEPSVSTITSSPVNITNDTYTYYYGADNTDIDYFYIVGNRSQIIVIFVSQSSGSTIYKYDTNNNVLQSQGFSSYSGYYYAAAYTAMYSTITDSTIPFLGTFTNINDAIDYYIVNGVTYPSTNVPAKYPFILQNGYLFVYDLGSSSASYSFDLTSKSEEYSNIGSNPFPDTNQSYWFSNSLPEIDETTIPAAGANNIIWSKGNKTNIFGQTQDMVSSISGTSTGRYLYLYNPPVHYNWSGSSNPSASEVVNYPVTIDGVLDSDTWFIYDSVARLADFNQGGTVSGTVSGDQITGNVTSEGAISLVTSSGALYIQNSGGSTDISGANGGSIAENINGLKQTLDNFVNQFIQLLSAPISHIQQLIQSGNSFFNIFGQLFDWLPSSVSSVLVSGLVIMVVIGVLKMLL